MHPSDTELDRRAAGRLSREAAARLERHLKGCRECEIRLAQAMALARAPGRFRHGVGRAKVELRISDVNGEVQAVLRDHGVELKRSFQTAAAARKYVRRSFGELFPGHQCGRGCG